MRLSVPRPHGRCADGIDVVLVIPSEATQASWSTHALLVAEGYRVTVAHDREEMLRAIVVANAAIVFVPSSAYGRDAVAVRRALHPLESVAVPIVILGEGWDTRMREHRGDAPSVAVEDRVRGREGAGEEMVSVDGGAEVAGAGTR